MLFASIDLTDPGVQQMLHELQEKERNRTSEECEPLDEDPRDASVQSIDAILGSMTNAQIAKMLAREGIDYHKISDREQFLETARQVLAAKLSISADAPRPEKSYFLPIFLMASAWTLLRLYSTGGLSFLYRLVERAFSGTGGDVDEGLVDDVLFGE